MSDPGIPNISTSRYLERFALFGRFERFRQFDRTRLASAFGAVCPVNGIAILLLSYKREDLTRMPSALVLSSRIEPTNAQLHLRHTARFPGISAGSTPACTSLCALPVSPLRCHFHLEDLRGVHVHPVLHVRRFTDRVSVAKGSLSDR